MQYERSTASPSPFTPLAQMDARRGRNEWQQLLEMLPGGLASKLGNVSDDIVKGIRAEVTDAVSVFRREAGAITVSSDRPVTSQLQRVEEKLQRVEKLVVNMPPALDFNTVQKEIREVETSCLNALKTVSERIEASAQDSNRLSSRMRELDSTFSDSLKRVEEKLQSEHSEFKRLEGKWSDELSKVQQSTQTAVDVANHLRSMLEQEEARILELDKSCAQGGVQLSKALDQLKDTTSRINDRMTSSNADTSQVLQRLEASAAAAANSEELRSLRSVTEVISKEMQKLQRQDDRHYAELGLSLESSLSGQQARLEELHDSLKMNLEPVLSQMQASRTQQTSEFHKVLGEISRMQQAMHIEYVRVPGLQNQPAAVRVREFFTQTYTKEKVDVYAQTSPVTLDGDEEKKKKKPRTTSTPSLKKAKPAFAGADKLKQAAKEKSMRPPYNVFDKYHDTGCVQYIAKSSVFEQMSLAMVVLNALWIGIDTDYNKTAMLIDSEPVFIIAENIFCAYFTFELVIRFGAFRQKQDAVRDGWFVFDLFLVALMIVETWIIPAVLLISQTSTAGGAANLTILRVVKMVKLVRLSRMARLLRFVPEMAIIVKGLRFASRSVGVFFLLWGMIVYIFAVLFRQLTDGSENQFSETVPLAMNKLLLNGVFPDNAALVSDVTNIDPWLWPLIIFFVTLVSMTLMYMLVGVLVDVVSVIAATEKEAMSVLQVASQMRSELRKAGYKEDSFFSQSDFQNLMLEPGVLRAVQSCGGDIVVLADMIDVIFEHFATDGQMRFADLVEAILSMRGSNPATVKDCQEQIRITKALLKDACEEIVGQIRSELGHSYVVFHLCVCAVFEALGLVEGK
ncbi:unnamed protein product [Effrenium voratum]|nr:unnamed protein product [Effrenium voratum]